VRALVADNPQGVVPNVVTTLGELARNALSWAWRAIARGKVMARLRQRDSAAAKDEAKELSGGLQQRLGMTPDMMKVMAASPALLGGYLGFSMALADGRLDAKFREQIALVVAHANNSDYCFFRHAAIAMRMGMSESEIGECLESRSNDAKTDAGLKFVGQLVLFRGRVNNGAVERVRAAGYSDAEIVEVVANVALDMFTNYLDQVAGAAVDLPKVSAMLKSNPAEKSLRAFP